MPSDFWNSFEWDLNGEKMPLGDNSFALALGGAVRFARFGLVGRNLPSREASNSVRKLYADALLFVDMRSQPSGEESAKNNSCYKDSHLFAKAQARGTKYRKPRWRNPGPPSGPAAALG